MRLLVPLALVPILSCASAPSTRAVALFDGASLRGWVTKGGRYDGDALWTVEDGAITGRQRPTGEGGLVYTARQYRNFVFRCDAKVDHPFDSGIFVRMSPHAKGAQVTIDDRPGGEIGAIYSDGFLLHNERGASLYRPGEWNHFEVRCEGDDLRLSARLNGALLCEYRLPERSEGYAPTGLIGLQVHGGRDDAGGKKAQFKNITIEELPDHDEELFVADARGLLRASERGARAGWRALCDGSSLAGWQLHGGTSGVRVEDGAIVLARVGDAQYVRTTRADFADFVLRLEFRIGALANSGVFLRGREGGGDPAYSGCEVQILDDFGWEAAHHTTLKPWQFTGSLYGAVAPAVRDALRPLGEWNSLEIRYRGSRMLTLLNGQLLYDVDTHTLADAKPPFRERAARGFIGLQRHAADGAGPDYAWFRNVFVRCP
jgi:3-keto-disaccharide hydrolase